MSLQPETQLGPYVIRARLGAGGMGEVYLADDPQLERTVAIKVLRPEVADDDQRVKRFLQDGKPLCTQSSAHPHDL